MEQRRSPSGVATVLAIDCSWSTALRGSFESIKSAAIALVDFIGSHFPADRIYIVKFAAYAKAVDPDELASLNWDESVLGTNMHHAFILAREWLQDRPEPTKEVIMLTDGEPTAHLERDRSYFAYPPSPVTLRETSEAVRECARAGIDVTLCITDPDVFASDALKWALGGDREIAQRVSVLSSSPAKLSETVITHYVEQKTRRSIERPQ